MSKQIQIKTISSAHNPLIKRLKLLSQKSKARREQRAFIIEGFRELGRAISCGYEVEFVCYHPSLTSQERVKALFMDQHPLHVQCSLELFEKIAYRAGVPNVVACVQYRAHDRSTFQSSISQVTHPLILVIDGVEKPGNIGAMLRSAEGLGAHGVILSDCIIDLEHPNVIRNSLGAALSLPIWNTQRDTAIQWLMDQRIEIIVTALTGARLPEDVNLSTSCAIVVGSEDRGVNHLWLSNDSSAVLIPMNGVVDSLNVSVTAAILLFEATRQRRVATLRESTT